MQIFEKSQLGIMVDKLHPRGQKVYIKGFKEVKGTPVFFDRFFQPFKGEIVCLTHNGVMADVYLEDYRRRLDEDEARNKANSRRPEIVQ